MKLLNQHAHYIAGHEQGVALGVYTIVRDATNIESTSFGDYLRFKRAAQVFHIGFIYPCLVFFATTVSLIVFKGTKFTMFADLVVFLLAYCIAVFITMVLNVATVMRLYGAFRVELENELRRDRALENKR